MADPNLEKDAPAQNPQAQGQVQKQSNGRPAPSPVPGPTPSPGPTKTASGSTSATRPPYIPQFTAATQMILKRMKGEPSSLSSALSAASNTVSVTSTIKPATYEDVKRRLVMGMTTSSSMTMQMPMASPPPPTPSTQPSLAHQPPTVKPQPSTYLTVPTPTPGPLRAKPTVSAIRRISSGLTVGGKPIATKPPVTKSPATKIPAVKTTVENKVVKKARAPRATGTATGRRKTIKREDDSSSLSSLSDLSGDEASSGQPPAAPQPQPHTMTKSGRQVQKPVTYNPADMESGGSRKRAHYGKRTAEQALCKKCSRMHSPANNQMVFCDGCNEGWHQRCHDPRITDKMVRDQNMNWYCAGCQAKREPRQPAAKKQRTEPPKQPTKESWAGKSTQQKRAYLMTLAQPDLVSLLMTSLELHPDLPIFPGLDGGNNRNSRPTSQHGGHPRSLFASSTTEGLFPRADAQKENHRGRANGKNGSKKEKEGSHDKAESAAADDLEEEFDPLVALWPKAGQGLYANLPPDTEDDEHLVDDGDYEAFSTIVYERGRKVMENGMKV